ncbi:MAG: hypothetical protein ACQEQH_06360 [Bacillota bacterium]
MQIIKRYRIYLFLFLASLITIILHEYGHYIMGTILGYNMGFDFNGSRPIGGANFSNTDQLLIVISGIMFTLVQSFIAYYLMIKLNYKRLYYLVLTPFIYRLIPYILSIFYPDRLILQDEVRMGNILGINLYIIPLIIIAILFINCFIANKKYKIGFNQHLKLSFISIISFIIIIKLNQILMFSI